MNAKTMPLDDAYDCVFLGTIDVGSVLVAVLEDRRGGQFVIVGGVRLYGTWLPLEVGDDRNARSRAR